jgi:hypothetical protein
MLDAGGCKIIQECCFLKNLPFQMIPAYAGRRQDTQLFAACSGASQQPFSKAVAPFANHIIARSCHPIVCVNFAGISPELCSTVMKKLQRASG